MCIYTTTTTTAITTTTTTANNKYAGIMLFKWDDYSIQIPPFCSPHFFLSLKPSASPPVLIIIVMIITVMIVMVCFVLYRVGRKKTVLCFFGVKITGMLMSWFGSSYTVFIIGRFLVGCGQVGFFISGFVLGTCRFVSPRSSHSR